MVGSGYIQLSAKGLMAGAGMFHMLPAQLDRYRRAVASDGTGGELERIVAALAGRDITIAGHDALKTAPRGYRSDHPRIGLLRYKGLVAWKEWPVEPWLETAAAKDRIADLLRAARPLCAWLDENVGPA